MGSTGYTEPYIQAHKNIKKWKKKKREAHSPKKEMGKSP